MSEQTFYRCEAKYGGLEVNQVHQMAHLQEENQRPKRLVADLTLDHTMLPNSLDLPDPAATCVVGSNLFERIRQSSICCSMAFHSSQTMPIRLRIIGVSAFSRTSAMADNASEPFYNPTFWGSPARRLKAGQIWNVTLAKPWELGPAGSQTLTVVSVDTANGIMVLKREGEGVGSYDGSRDTASLRRKAKSTWY